MAIRFLQTSPKGTSRTLGNPFVRQADGGLPEMSGLQPRGFCQQPRGAGSGILPRSLPKERSPADALPLAPQGPWAPSDLQVCTRRNPSV